MEYFLIAVCFFIGVGFHIMAKIGDLRKQFPTLTPKSVINTFFSEEWNVLATSLLCLLLLEVLQYVVIYNKVELTGWAAHWLFKIGLSLVTGYGGQRIIYKYLGTAETVLETQVDKLNKS